VTFAVYAMFAIAAFQLVGMVLSVANVGTTVDAIRDAAGTGPDVDSMISITKVSAYGGVVVYLLFAAGWILLGLFDLRGKQVARIITWVLAGLSLCCTSAGLFSVAASNLTAGNNQINGVSASEIQRRVEEAQPAYIKPVTLTLLVVDALLILAVIILLALPQSNDFFRKRPESIWEPPLPGQPYPPA